MCLSAFVKLSETSGEELGSLNKLIVGVLLLIVGSLSVFESSKDRESKFSLRTVAVRSLSSTGVMTPQWVNKLVIFLLKFRA